LDFALTEDRYLCGNSF